MLFLILAFDFDVRTEGAALDKQVAAPFTVRLETHCKAPTHIPPSDADCQTSVECFMGGKTEPPYLFPDTRNVLYIEDGGDNLSPRREPNTKLILLGPDIEDCRGPHNPRDQPILAKLGRGEVQRGRLQSDPLLRQERQNFCAIIC